jgi:hypothetical protein
MKKLLVAPLIGPGFVALVPAASAQQASPSPSQPITRTEGPDDGHG